MATAWPISSSALLVPIPMVLARARPMWCSAGRPFPLRSIWPAGDVNRDGFDDIVVSATQADNGGADSGSTYVIYGHRADSSVTRIGTDLDNHINGGRGDDVISGLDGNDALIGWEGDDLIKG